MGVFIKYRSQKKRGESECMSEQNIVKLGVEHNQQKWTGVGGGMTQGGIS